MLKDSIRIPTARAHLKSRAEAGNTPRSDRVQWRPAFCFARSSISSRQFQNSGAFCFLLRLGQHYGGTNTDVAKAKKAILHKKGAIGSDSSPDLEPAEIQQAHK
jgi:hypothetical protein